MTTEKTPRRRSCPWEIRKLEDGQFRGCMTLTLLADTEQKIRDAFNSVKAQFDAEGPSVAMKEKGDKLRAIDTKNSQNYDLAMGMDTEEPE